MGMPTSKQATGTKPDTKKVRFSLPADVNAERAVVCGEFNDWSPTAHRMRRFKDGRFVINIPLDRGREYRYRFLLDDERWTNDPAAEALVPNRYGGEDCLIRV
jgi:1,4-alpha-glucan branching enzyme